MECEKYKKGARDEMSLTKVTWFFAASVIKSNDAVLAAEGAFAFHTVKYHSSYKTVDCTSLPFKRIFPDSEIAPNFSRAWSKTEAIITSVTAPPAIENIKHLL
jgi:hypothetical protein